MQKNTRMSDSYRLMIFVRNVMSVVTLLIVTATVFVSVYALRQPESISTTSATSLNQNTSATVSIETTIATVVAGAIQTVTSQLTQAPETTTIVTTQEATTAAEPTEETTKIRDDSDTPDLSGYVVVLDPGHQTHANDDQEPVAPGSEKTKAKCSSGTQGVSTGRPEYEVNLEISLLLREYLESLGCTVYMTRTENDVDISNIERAEYALSKNPDVYLRIHCNGSDSSSTRGISVFVADSGTYQEQLPEWGEMLGQALADTTGSEFLYCSATSVYSGLNWATDVPSFLLELGFMTNPDEDELLSDSSYQKKICQGVASFIASM